LRLDVFLKRVGLCKQRTLAKELCDRGRVKMDGGVAKAGKEVSRGRTVEIEFKRETIKIEITDLPERNYRKQDGEAFYNVIERAESDLFS
jgi:ribosomal 50S subunit-recycling heat shock protein